ncbi:MAG: hypothetical protein COB61_009175 [Thiotrichales bacterium]|nr:hypothetical protein [Thiotrichales bacterium]
MYKTGENSKPLSVRRYAGAIEQLAKTDKIDAALIAQFAAIIQPRITSSKEQKPNCNQRVDFKAAATHGHSYTRIKSG